MTFWSLSCYCPVALQSVPHCSQAVERFWNSCCFGTFSRDRTVSIYDSVSEPQQYVGLGLFSFLEFTKLIQTGDDESDLFQENSAPTQRTRAQNGMKLWKCYATVCPPHHQTQLNSLITDDSFTSAKLWGSEWLSFISCPWLGGVYILTMCTCDHACTSTYPVEYKLVHLLNRFQCVWG